MPANEQPNREKAMFEAALEHSTALERAAFLQHACGDDTALRQRMEALLCAHAGGEGFLPDSSLPPSRPPAPFTEKPGDLIGRYKLLQQIGEGGCGVVFMAEQETPVRRRVALKIIKLGLDTRQVVARFEAERQALALMDHPNIAKVLDAGATDTGRPYFVMELVRGAPLTTFCEENHLSIRQRLELLMLVCRAVEHAHQKGIIHRDLKPSNILVTVNDGVPVPKVIDFGIAKATTGQQLTDRTLFTAFEQFMGTPAYMSPEQAVLTSLDIDTRSDIYSLGVLLYELLTGKTPFDARKLWEGGLDEMRRTIREVEPVKPSTRLSLELGKDDPRRLKPSSVPGASPGVEMIQVSPRRLLQVKELIPAVRGDLDWIVMKALEKDRSRRYETANGFAADIQRHLRSEPVFAGPPSRIYRMRKLVRRHRLAFAAGMIVGVGLLTGLAAASWGLHRERLARARAESAERSAKNESRKSQQVSHILRNMLTGAAPEVARGRDTAVLREMVDATAANVERDARGQPEVEADVRATLGSVYDALGDYAKAEGQLRQGLALREKVFGAEHRQVAESLHLLGASLYHQRRASEAEALFRRALAMRRKLGADGIEVAESMNNLALALTLQGQSNEAASLRRDALALQVRLLGSNHTEVAISVHNLGNDLLRQRQYAEAEPYLRRALGLYQKVYATNHPAVASAQHDLASALYKQSRNAEAETLFRDALRLKQELYGPDHAEVAGTLRNLGSLLRRSGRLAEAEDCFRDALARARRGGLFSSQDLEECVYNVGSVVVDRAWAELESAPEDARGNPGLAARGREAETLLRECLALHLRTAGTNDPPSANVRSHLAAALTLVAVTDAPPAPGRAATLATAEALLLAAHARLQTSTSIAPELKRKAVLHLARLYQAWAKPEKALEWQTKLREQKDLP